MSISVTQKKSHGDQIGVFVQLFEKYIFNHKCYQRTSNGKNLSTKSTQKSSFFFNFLTWSKDHDETFLTEILSIKKIFGI